MNLDSEIRRLLDLMPASGRMLTKIIHKPQQSKVVSVDFPYPWKRGNRPIYINFDLWRLLPTGARDLLLLRTISWLTGVKWFKPDLYQGIVVLGAVDSVIELTQGDALGFLIAGGLGALAASQIWQSNRSSQREIDADEAAIKVAQRRGYNRTEAATNLLKAIEEVAKIEGRSSLSFSELIRSQNLRSMMPNSNGKPYNDA